MAIGQLGRELILSFMLFYTNLCKALLTGDNSEALSA